MASEREQTRSAARAAIVAATIMIAAQVGGKATRDALFLTIFPISELPKLMLAGALVSALGVVAMSRGLSVFGPRRLVPVLYALNGLAFVGEWALVPRWPGPVAIGVYIHVAAFGSLLISGFWSVVSERFDPHTAKKVIGGITNGATAGGVIGGLTAERVAAWLDVRSMLVALAFMSLLCASAVFAMGGPAPSFVPEDEERPRAGLSLLSETPYLKQLAALVALTALTAGALDFVFKAEAASVFKDGKSLMKFFAVFYTATGLLTVLLQTSVRKRALARLKLSYTVAILPFAVGLLGILGAAFTRLWSVVLVRGVQGVVYNSLYRSCYEVLFTPLSPEKKRPTKTVIDVGFDRLGGAIASGLVMLALAFLAPAVAVKAILGIAVIACLVALLVVKRLNRGYVAELASSLRQGRVKLDEEDIIDATTRRTLAETTAALNREQLLAQIEILREKQVAQPEIATEPTLDSTMSSVGPEPEPIENPLSDALRDPLDALLSNEPARVREALRSDLDVRLVGLVIPLLGSGAYARHARRCLRRAAPKIIGQLIDALTDSSLDVVARKRLPDVMKVYRTKRSARGLLAGLDDEERVVRERCAWALRELIEGRPELAPSAEEVFLLVGKQARREGPLDLRHLFSLLALILDAEPVRLALSGVRNSDMMLRGTSLEYLENVVPESVWEVLWPRLKELGSAQVSDEPPPSRRNRQELAEELKRSVDSLELDRKLLLGPPPESEDEL